jgi:hypothetical protein
MIDAQGNIKFIDTVMDITPYKAHPVVRIIETVYKRYLFNSYNRQINATKTL